jgi:hypothetical protein
MIDLRVTPLRRTGACVALFFSLVVLVGCDSGPPMGDVSGTVSIDGQVPAEGSSITFFPNGGKSPSAGALIKEGKYSARVAVGPARVEIRIPKPASKAKQVDRGPSSAGSGLIEYALPVEYHEKSKLTFDVQRGSNEKNWDVSATKLP